MKLPLQTALACAVAISAALLSQTAVAQGVVDSRPYTSNPSQTLGNAASTANSDALSLLLEQNQQLRAELQTLRGLVEEQGFEIRKLQRDSLNRYTNIDNRLTDLENAAPGPAAPAAAAVSPAVEAAADTPIAGTATLTPRSPSARTEPTVSRTSRSGRGSLQPAVLSEQQLYQMAYDSVINSNFELSIAEFDQYLSAHPEGRFVTNAHYWKGQAYLYLKRFTEARDSYEIILEQYPDSAKLPDAMYGLGLAYQGMGNIQQARQLLNDIKRRFPNTGVANLADTRLLSLD